MSEPLSLGGLGPYLTILVGAAIPTQVWRWAGVLLAGRLSEDSELFEFVKAVATALVAGVVARLILFPDGPLADVPAVLRCAAALAGFAVYIVSRHRLILGVATAEALLVTAYFATA